MHIELLYGSPGSYYDVRDGGAGLHHIGVWVDDVTKVNQDLVSQGYTVELAGASPEEGYGAFTYVRSPGGVLFEPESGLHGVQGTIRAVVCRWKPLLTPSAKPCRRSPAGRRSSPPATPTVAGGASRRARSARCRWTRRWCSPAWPTPPSASRRSPRRTGGTSTCCSTGTPTWRCASPPAARPNSTGRASSPTRTACRSSRTSASRCAARAYSKVDGGDHLVLIGRVEEVGLGEEMPFVYFRRKFHSLPLGDDKAAGTAAGARPQPPGRHRAGPRLDVTHQAAQLSGT